LQALSPLRGSAGLPYQSPGGISPEIGSPGLYIAWLFSPSITSLKKIIIKKKRTPTAKKPDRGFFHYIESVPLSLSRQEMIHRNVS